MREHFTLVFAVALVFLDRIFPPDKLNLISARLTDEMHRTRHAENRRSYDLEDNVLWSLQGPMSNLVIPSPIASNGPLFVTSGYIGDKVCPVYVIKPMTHLRSSIATRTAQRVLRAVRSRLSHQP